MDSHIPQRIREELEFAVGITMNQQQQQQPKDEPGGGGGGGMTGGGVPGPTRIDIGAQYAARANEAATAKAAERQELDAIGIAIARAELAKERAAGHQRLLLDLGRGQKAMQLFSVGVSRGAVRENLGISEVHLRRCEQLWWVAAKHGGPRWFSRHSQASGTDGVSLATDLEAEIAAGIRDFDGERVAEFAE